MSDAARIRRNSVYAFFSTVVRLAANMLMFVGIARLFGPSVFGQFSVTFTYLTLFYLCADFGLDVLLASEISSGKQRAEEIVAKFLPLKLVVSVLVMALMAGTSFLGGLGSEATILMLIFCPSIIANSLTTFFFAMFRGREELHHEAITSLFQNVILLLMLVLTGIIGASIFAAAVVFVISRYIGAMLIYLRVRHSGITINLNVDLSNLKSVMKKCMPYGVHLLFGALYFQLDTLMLIYLQGERVVGIYQAVVRLAMLVLIVPDVVSSAIFPALVRYHQEDERKYLRLSFLMRKGLYLAGLIIAFVLMLFSPEIISAVYGGKGYEEAIPILRVFALTIVIRYAFESFALMLTASKQQTVRMWIVIGATVFNFALNVVLIPHYGVMGAAVVSVITNLVAGLFYVWGAGRRLALKVVYPDVREIGLTFITIAIGVTLWTLLQNSILASTFVAIVLLLCVGIFGFSRDEWQLLLTTRGDSNIRSVLRFKE